MQVNEVVGQVPQGVRLPLVNQPAEPGRAQAEAREPRTGTDDARPLAAKSSKGIEPDPAPHRYGAGF